MGCLTALVGVGIAVLGLFLPWPSASVLCGILGVVLLVRGYMTEASE